MPPPTCPACGFRIFNRRFPKCERCGAALPEAIAYSAQELAALREKEGEEERQAQRRKAAASGTANDFGIALDMGDTDASCDGGGGGCD